MDPMYSELSLVELKQIAKQRRIKQYYIMKRLQLIQLLTMTELPIALKIEKMTIHQLREEARRKGLRGYWSLRRDQLVKLLFPEDVDQTTPDKNEKNHCKTEKHDTPQKHNAKEVGVENVKHSGDDGLNHGVLNLG
jgi:hypothetical protein